ncbi:MULTISPECIES: tryptophan--tRNA ligase [Campylobacter]|uniref:tryptophan--tRNA ligase n=1 Tax=Campylobacter TaxID=194 RepID=UPI000A32B377|nr:MULTISPECIES: tryptophan--tRNA ligase [unclassified Campylobacter]MCR8679797.1 tryptophan--tRNA ligase [Campylobacter sp. RM19072]MCR8697059.1 tryptophan--tRNA ligase [Campylobacter sp. RM19073]
MRTLTGLQPSGKLHLGNYFASIKPMIDRQNSSDDEMFIFIANYHAMTSLNDAKSLKANTIEAAAAFLSLGIDPNRSTFWVQSDVKDVLELYWILSQLTPMGLVERAHAYKDKVAKGLEANHGLFSYPILMAADILLFNADKIPVGKDQIQHVEIARDLALKFNNTYKEIFTLPKADIAQDLATIPGTDGAKMSKSYKNTIDIFSDAKTLKKQCNSVVTNSTPLEEPKDWQSCNIYAIARLFLNEKELGNLQDRYAKGGEGYGHFKAYLNELVWNYFAPARDKFDYYMNNQNEIIEILNEGGKKAQKISNETMEKVRDFVGIY